ncbi:hypothetical protein GGF31_004235 [Allomyces arbusculus]|nr:hypothetical protein GGF31_004235 [Allomyces arbusculus]
MDPAPPPLDALGDARLLDRTLVCPRAFGRLRACLAQEHNHELADFWADFMLLVTLPKYLSSWAGPTPSALFPALAPDTAAGALTAPNAADDWRRLASALPPVLAAAAAGIPSLPATPTTPTAPTPENNRGASAPAGGTEVTSPPARAASLHATSPIHHGEEMALNVRSSWLWPEPRTPRDGGLGAFPPYPPVVVEYAMGGAGEAGVPLAPYTAAGEGSSSSSSATPPQMHAAHGHHHHLWSRDRTASSASLGSASFSGSGSNGSAVSATASPSAPSPTSSPAMSSLAKLWRKALTLTTGSSSGGSSPRASPSASPVYDPADPDHHSHHEHGSGWFGRSPNSRKRRPTTLHVATPATAALATPPSPPWATMPTARATTTTVAIRPLPPPTASLASLSDDAAAAAAAARAPAFRPVVLTSPLGAWQPPTTSAASLTNAPPPSPATCAAVARRLRRALVRRYLHRGAARELNLPGDLQARVVAAWKLGRLRSASTADNDTDDETLWHDLDALLAVVADEVRRMVRATRAWAMVAADSPQIDDPRYPAAFEDEVPPPDPASPRRPAWDTLRELGLISGAATTNGGAVAVAAEPPPPPPHAVHLLAPPPAVARRVSMRVAAVDDAHQGKRAGPTTTSPPRTPRDMALSPAAAALVDVDRSMAEVLAASEWGHWRAREPPSPASPSWSS